MERHTIIGGTVQLYRRGEGGNWHCSASFKGQQFRHSTKEPSLPLAEEKAEDWYLDLRGKLRAGVLPPKGSLKPRGATKSGRSFDEASQIFLAEYQIAVAPERSERWVKEHEGHLKNHLNPFFGKTDISQITDDSALQYQLYRSEHSSTGKPPARNTIKNELITARLVLKTAQRKGWVTNIPNMSLPYKGQRKVSHRPWFTPEEYKKLYLAAREYAKKPTRERFKWDAEQLYDQILFMGNTGLRPDEINRLRHRDIKMVKDRDTGELLLEIEIVEGKVGVGNCKSRPDAVKVYQRLLNRPKWVPQGRKPKTKKQRTEAAQRPAIKPELPKPNDLVFPADHKKVFNKILADNDIKFDRQGQRHTLYSLRHSYICSRLTEGANIYELAKNCRTSVEMIQKHYAVHIANQLDAAAINTRRLRRRGKAEIVRAD